MNSYPNVYFQNQVETASREELLIMLYDGAVMFLRQARQAMEEDRKTDKLEKTGKVVNILTELSNTLDFENGGDLAVHLDSLYWYMIRELIRSNTQNDPEPLNVAERILVDLRDGWSRAIEQNKPSPRTATPYGQETEEPKEVRPISAAV